MPEDHDFREFFISPYADDCRFATVNYLESKWHAILFEKDGDKDIMGDLAFIVQKKFKILTPSAACHQILRCFNRLHGQFLSFPHQ